MLIAAFFEKKEATILFLFTLLSWAFALFAAKVLRATVLRGPKTPFVMELPPYRFPTIKGLLIHTWERTWHYIKKAGTIILSVAVILWAVMTFPGLSEDRARFYKELKSRNVASFISSSATMGWVPGEEDLRIMDDLFNAGSRIFNNSKGYDESQEKGPLFLIAMKAHSIKRGNRPEGKGNERLDEIASAYVRFRDERSRIERLEQEEKLKGTIAGKVGIALERITGIIGFDYRTNIALVGGFAAKEVIVSTLGTAYSLGDVEPGEAGSLSEKLSRDPGWNPLVAFCLILFTMLYVPCFATLASIKKESSWGWAGFSIAFNLVVAYVVAFAVYQLGSAVGIGS
jgi:ferrous iron transport protein B